MRGCTSDGCAVELLDSSRTIAAAYADPVRGQIRIRRGQLVAVDTGSEPPRIVYRWFLGTIDGVEGNRFAVIRRDGEGKVLAREGQRLTVLPAAAGLTDLPAPGDDVFFGGTPEWEVIAIARGGRPLDSARFEAAFPAIERYYSSLP